MNASPLHVDEPLADSAMQAWEWSQSLCRADGQDSGCAWYHGSWQVLRLLGVFNSIRSDDDFFLAELDAAIDRGARRFLVSGAADYALLARIAAMAASHDVVPEVTVVDRCETPLELNRWFAGQAGLNIELLRADILGYQPSGCFDMVCTHSFLCFFDAAGRRKLAATWWRCLAPGGAVLTAQRTRPGDSKARIDYSPEQITALGERAYRLASDQYSQLGIDAELARSLAEGYATHHWTYLIRQAEELRRLFEQQGFVLEHFAPPDQGQFEADTPGTPNETDTHRWRILARKP